MNTKPKHYHHFKGNNLTPSERIERKVVQILLTSKLPDKKRESSVVFELKHSSECVQVVRILAQKRKLNIALSEAIAALHDINVIVNGTYKNHAALGAIIAKNILKNIAGFSANEIETICEAIKHHSEKNIYSDNPELSYRAYTSAILQHLLLNPSLPLLF